MKNFRDFLISTMLVAPFGIGFAYVLVLKLSS